MTQYTTEALFWRLESLFIKTGFLYVALIVLELSVDQAGLKFQNARIKDICHHCLAIAEALNLISGPASLAQGPD